MDKYQQRASKTWHKELSPDSQRLHLVLGLVGESGEVAEHYKKAIFKPGHESTREQRLDELGDVFYYLCLLAHLDDCTIDELSELNTAKLADGHGWVPDYMRGADG